MSHEIATPMNAIMGMTRMRFGKISGTGAGDGLLGKIEQAIRASFEIDYEV